MEKFDVCVIGIGTIGAFASYYLSKSGLKTAMVDLYAPSHNEGSYHGDTRIFRIAYGEGEKYIPMLKGESLKKKLIQKCLKELAL